MTNSTVPAKCIKCGWLGLRGLDRVDPRVMALWESTGIEPPLINRCRACKVGECVDIEGAAEFEGAISGHLSRQLAELMPGVELRVTAWMRERAERVTLTASVGDLVSTFEITAAQVDSPNLRKILDRIAAAMHRELAAGRQPEPVEPVAAASPPTLWRGGPLRRFNHAPPPAPTEES